MLKTIDGKLADFKALFTAYERLPGHSVDPDVRDNIKTAMITAGLGRLPEDEQMARMYDPDGDWYGVIEFMESLA